MKKHLTLWTRNTFNIKNKYSRIKKLYDRLKKIRNEVNLKNNFIRVLWYIYGKIEIFTRDPTIFRSALAHFCIFAIVTNDLEDVTMDAVAIGIVSEKCCCCFMLHVLWVLLPVVFSGALAVSCWCCALKSFLFQYELPRGLDWPPLAPGGQDETSPPFTLQTYRYLPQLRSTQLTQELNFSTFYTPDLQVFTTTQKNSTETRNSETPDLQYWYLPQLISTSMTL